MLGATGCTPIQVIGTMAKEDCDKLMISWEPVGQPPSPTLRSKAALFGRAARISCGLEITLAQAKKQEEVNKAHELDRLKLQIEIAAQATANSAANASQEDDSAASDALPDVSGNASE